MIFLVEDSFHENILPVELLELLSRGSKGIIVGLNPERVLVDSMDVVFFREPNTIALELNSGDTDDTNQLPVIFLRIHDKLRQGHRLDVLIRRAHQGRRRDTVISRAACETKASDKREPHKH